MSELTEQRVQTLIDLAVEYATKRNLSPVSYVNGMLDVNTLGSADAGQIVETLIKYHKEWLK